MSAGSDRLAFGLQMLAEDLQSARIPANERPQSVMAALDDGTKRADAALVRWGSDPDAIACACGVPVVESNDDAGFGTTLVFAEYGTRPPLITLYSRPIVKLDECIALYPEFRRCLPGGMRPVFLAHELYHHFDCIDARGPIARRHAVTVFRMGRWRWTAGLRSLAEIAAGAFGQRLLGLPFYPGNLDQLVRSWEMPS
jgi:hypothetical protein